MATGKELSTAVQTLNPEQIELVKRTVAKGATNDELALFLYTASRTGLDPLTRQIHFIKRRNWSKAANGGKGGYIEVGTTQTGIDGYRVVAARNGLAGIDDAIYDSEEAINPKKASVTVYRLVAGTRAPFTATARWTEYVATDRDGNPTAMWKKMPYLMLAKVAEALALRKAFPNDLSGLYTDEEMNQADSKMSPAEFDQTPVAEDAIIQIAGVSEDEEMKLDENGKPDYTSPAPAKKALPTSAMPPWKKPTKLQQKNRIMKLIDSIVINPLEKTKEAYTDYVFQNLTLNLDDPNDYDAIIEALEKKKAGEDEQPE